MEKKDISVTENNDLTFAQKAGRVVGTIFFSTAALCVMTLLVALTVKLVLLIL